MPAVSLIRQGGSVKYTIIFYPTRFGYGPHGLQSAPIDDVTFIQWEYFLTFFWKELSFGMPLQLFASWKRKTTKGKETLSHTYDYGTVTWIDVFGCVFKSATNVQFNQFHFCAARRISAISVVNQSFFKWIQFSLKRKKYF